MKKECRTILRHPSGAVVTIKDDAEDGLLAWLAKQTSPFRWLHRLGFRTERSR